MRLLNLLSDIFRVTIKTLGIELGCMVLDFGESHLIDFKHTVQLLLKVKML